MSSRTACCASAGICLGRRGFAADDCALTVIGLPYRRNGSSPASHIRRETTGRTNEAECRADPHHALWEPAANAGGARDASGRYGGSTRPIEQCSMLQCTRASKMWCGVRSRPGWTSSTTARCPSSPLWATTSSDWVVLRCSRSRRRTANRCGGRRLRSWTTQSSSSAGRSMRRRTPRKNPKATLAPSGPSRRSLPVR